MRSSDRRGRPRRRPKALRADRGYTGGPVREHLRGRGIMRIIPQLGTGTRPRRMDRSTYRERNVVERLVGPVKEHRRPAMRYEKLASSYLAFVHLAAVLIRLERSPWSSSDPAPDQAVRDPPVPAT